MKKMKPQSTQRCTYCKERADWRSGGLSSVAYACTAHQQKLREHEAATRDNGYMTEADHQSWGRL